MVGLAVAGGEEPLLVAGLFGGVGRPARIGLRVLAGGRVTTEEVPDAGTPAFLRAYAGPGGWWLLWKERAGGALLARRRRYGPAGGWDPPLTLYRTSEPDRVYDAHLLPASSGELALLVRVAAARGGDVHRFRDLVALLPPDGTVDGFRQLAEPGTTWSAAGWLDGRLVLLHGATSPLVTVLTPAGGPG